MPDYLGIPDGVELGGGWWWLGGLSVEAGTARATGVPVALAT
ncbi:hypothetical protein [Nocardia sp. NPDC057272]